MILDGDVAREGRGNEIEELIADLRDLWGSLRCAQSKRKGSIAQAAPSLTYGDPDKIQAQCPDLLEDQVAICDFGHRPETRFYATCSA